MVAPLLQAHVDINAPVAKVWELISDLRRMPEWSPQCRWMKPFGPVRQGTRTLNLNRRNRMFWPTTCTVVEIVPDRKLAFRVDTNNTVWSYELEPAGEGTRVIESRHAENGVTAFSNLSVKALFGGTDNFEHELLDGMNASLARIKAAAEDVARG
ncbi:SRPBCC family protein [Mycobacterium marseillense]|uniref:SRPBCC family protein n=1 Tax=Mycobacterium marseillense TaxID=701042 RepID=UPI0007FC2E07|nr:SRPBCC family protein [Mycobacterium marseillense]MCA2264276.1 SRPBCC family protein [Mycobacterium marseillense]MDM3976292.1 SRPBCC family protein [Mycobacterium marseillense]OBJ75602.1 polyketide cyclase [Mycobacterium marseillense]